MLDELLGRATLKERIETLEDEKEQLQRQLDAESERRASVETSRQEAERRANRLEDRVTELEDRVDRLSDTEESYAFRRQEDLTGDRLDAILTRLDSFEAPADGAFSAFVEPGGLDQPLRDAFGDRVSLISRASPCFAFVDDAGMCAVTLDPPIPAESFRRWSDHFEIDRSHFEPTGSFTFALVRSDLFAMGEYAGRDRVAFHGFDSDLRQTHSKGGFSQARFERRRDEQIDTHLERCRVALDQRDTDTLYVVGERTVIDEVAQEADVTDTVDATGDPEDALVDAFYDFWQTTLSVI